MDREPDSTDYRLLEDQSFKFNPFYLAGVLEPGFNPGRSPTWPTYVWVYYNNRDHSKCIVRVCVFRLALAGDPRFNPMENEKWKARNPLIPAALVIIWLNL
jgi:hypothetical protein